MEYATHTWDIDNVITDPNNGAETYICKVCKATKIVQKDSRKSNTMTISKTRKTYKRSNLKSKKTYTIKVTKASGKVTYKLSRDAKKAKIKVKKVSYKTSGKGDSAKVTAQYRITVPKKCKKGTYIINFTAAGNNTYKDGKKTTTIEVK